MRAKILWVLVVVAFPILLAWLLYPAMTAQLTSGIDFSVESSTSNEDSGKIDVSILFPAYNEEKRLSLTLDSTYEYIHNHEASLGLSYEVLIIDDGSSDKTVDLARKYMAEHSRTPMTIVKLNTNKGKGGAIKRGVSIARGNYILMADADGATDIRDFAKLYNQLQKVKRQDSELGIAIGSRAHLEEKSIATRALYRTILMRGFHFLVTLMCTNKIRDTQCGFKLFTRKAALSLFPALHLERWVFDIELIYLAETLGIPMVEVSVNWTEVPGSKLIKSKMDVITTSLEMARDIVCVRLSYLLGIWNVPTL